MVGLGPAVERGEEIVLLITEVEFVEHAAPRRRHPGIQTVTGESHLRPPVEVVIVGRGFDPRGLPPLRPIGAGVGSDQLAIDGIAEVRQVDAAKGTVPVGTVALTAVEGLRGFGDRRGIGDGLTAGRQSLQPPAHRHHAGVHLVGFRISHAEIPPRAAAQKPCHAGQTGISGAGQPGIDAGQLRLRRQHPFHHLAVAALRQPHRASRRHLADHLRREGHLDPVGVGLEQTEEGLQPPLVEAGLAGVGPDAEFLAVVAKHGQRARPTRREIAKVIDRGLRRRERDHVAKVFADREDRERGAVPLGEPMPVELVLAEAGRLEVGVVEDRPLDSGGSNVAGHAGIPDPLGHPHAGHLGLESPLQPLRRQPDLSDAVPRRQHREHGFVAGAADDLDLSFADQTGHAVEVVGMVAVQPLRQRSARVQGQPDTGMAFEQFQQRQVAVAVGLFDDTVKIADGLMVVENEDEPDGGRHGEPWG